MASMSSRPQCVKDLFPYNNVNNSSVMRGGLQNINVSIEILQLVHAI